MRPIKFNLLSWKAASLMSPGFYWLSRGSGGRPGWEHWVFIVLGLLSIAAGLVVALCDRPKS